MLVVDQMAPAPGPAVQVLLAKLRFASRAPESPGTGQRFGLDPEILVAVPGRAIGREAVDQPTMLRVPAVAPGRQLQPDRPLQPALLRAPVFRASLAWSRPAPPCGRKIAG